MGDFIFDHSSLDNVIQITPKTNIGKTNVFIKNYEKKIFAENGIEFIPTEEYQIKENNAIFRGIHFQNYKPQKRIITILSGAAYIIAVDLNKESPQLGNYEIFLSKEETPKLIYVPEWYGIATISTKNNTVISVMSSGQYYEPYSSGICYDDGTLNIQWPLQEFQVSEKDKNLMTFKEYLCL